MAKSEDPTSKNSKDNYSVDEVTLTIVSPR
jgi:hypothetical protein